MDDLLRPLLHSALDNFARDTACEHMDHGTASPKKLELSFSKNSVHSPIFFLLYTVLDVINYVLTLSIDVCLIPTAFMFNLHKKKT